MSDVMARRAVASPAWRWLRGMVDTRGDVCIDVRNDGAWWSSGIGAPWCDPHGERVPDLTDAATLGAVEHGILGPAGVYVEREHSVDGARWVRAYRAVVVEDVRGFQIASWPARATLAESLVDGVEHLGTVTP